MDNLVQCSKCKKVMMDEEYSSHTCLPKLKDWKTIKIAHFYINEDEFKRKHMHILGWDGIDYDFIEEKEEKESCKMSYELPNLNTEKNHGKHPNTEQIFL